MAFGIPFFLWLPLVAVALHLIEEFVWPGGFPEWFRWYHPERASSVTTRFLVIVNVVLVFLALMPPAFGSTPRGFAFWLMVAAIGVANAVFHIYATISRKKYSPGLVTGTLGYLPLGILAYSVLIRPGVVSIGTTVEAIIVGAGYHIWSGWNHKRRAAAALT